jgi:hypothetical protein
MAKRSLTPANPSEETGQELLRDNTGTEQEANTADTSEISSDLLEEALKTEISVQDRLDKRSLTKQQFDQVVGDVAKTYNCSPSVAYIGICSTLQAGGSNKNKRSNVKITIDKWSFESKKVNEAIAKHCKTLTPRQFARILGNDIFQISKKHGITGNAYVSLKRYYPNLLLSTDIDEKFWAADFQVDNPCCPEYIRNALRQRYADKFTKTSK